MKQLKNPNSYTDERILVNEEEAKLPHPPTQPKNTDQFTPNVAQRCLGGVLFDLSEAIFEFLPPASYGAKCGHVTTPTEDPKMAEIFLPIFRIFFDENGFICVFNVRKRDQKALYQYFFA